MTGSVKVAVIPAAGLGTRMMPLTKCVPKELLPVGMKPVIHHVVEEGLAAGIEEFVFVVRPGDQRLMDYFSSSDSLERALAPGSPERCAYASTLIRNACFRAIVQQEPRGLGHAVLQAQNPVGNRMFAVMLPDMLIDPAAKGMAAMTANSENSVMLMKVPPERTHRYGIAGISGAEGVQRITRLVEKPGPGDAPSNWAVLGRYVLDSEIFGLLGELPKKEGEMQLTDAVGMLAGRTRVTPVALEHARCFDCGAPEGYAKACAELAATVAE